MINYFRSDSANAISWVRTMRGPWKMQFLFNEICRLVSDMPVMFQHISRSANGMADCLAKQGVDRSCNLSAYILQFVAGTSLLYQYHFESYSTVCFSCFVVVILQFVAGTFLLYQYHFESCSSVCFSCFVIVSSLIKFLRY